MSRLPSSEAIENSMVWFAHHRKADRETRNPFFLMPHPTENPAGVPTGATVIGITEGDATGAHKAHCFGKYAIMNNPQRAALVLNAYYGLISKGRYAGDWTREQADIGGEDRHPEACVELAVLKIRDINGGARVFTTLTDRCTVRQLVVTPDWYTLPDGDVEEDDDGADLDFGWSEDEAATSESDSD